jgi:hypothetical protein
LRAEGIARFPLELGLHFERRCGESLDVVKGQP